jgi:hypothetical protein
MYTYQSVEVINTKGILSWLSDFFCSFHAGSGAPVLAHMYIHTAISLACMKYS